MHPPAGLGGQRGNHIRTGGASSADRRLPRANAIGAADITVRMRPSRSSRSPSGAQNSARLEFALLWDTYARSIYSYCFRRTADAALAEDLTSIVFLEAWGRPQEGAVSPP